MGADPKAELSTFTPEPHLHVGHHHQGSPSPISITAARHKNASFLDTPPASPLPWLLRLCTALKGCEKTWKGSPGWYGRLEQGAICARGRGGRAHGGTLDGCREEMTHRAALLLSRGETKTSQKNKNGLFWLVLLARPRAGYRRLPPCPAPASHGAPRAEQHLVRFSTTSGAMLSCSPGFAAFWTRNHGQEASAEWEHAAVPSRARQIPSCAHLKIN